MEEVGSVVLAAGLSQRMGKPKMTLPWGSTTVIGQVVSVLVQAGIENIVVVCGSEQYQIEEALRRFAVTVVFNPRYAEDQMHLSLQVGLAELPSVCQASLIILGDQPQIQAGVVQSIVGEHQRHGYRLIVPSFHNRRGHPWLVARSLWPGILALRAPYTLRDWLRRNTGLIHYLVVSNDSVLRDLDTPEDYQREKPD